MVRGKESLLDDPGTAFHYSQGFAVFVISNVRTMFEELSFITLPEVVRADNERIMRETSRKYTKIPSVP